MGSSRLSGWPTLFGRTGATRPGGGAAAGTAPRATGTAPRATGTARPKNAGSAAQRNGADVPPGAREKSVKEEGVKEKDV